MDYSKEDDTQPEGSRQSNLNMKLINTTSGPRVSQACDRCRIKKIKCNGLTPCLNCSKIGFDCKTSDKLTRRAFPKGYTENLERRIRDLEEENERLKAERGNNVATAVDAHTPNRVKEETRQTTTSTTTNPHQSSVPINNPIDQIFNLDSKGVIIGNDNLNFESQFNHLLINLNLPFLKITNSHNYLLNDPNAYLYHPAYTAYNQFHNRDLDVIYNPLTARDSAHDMLDDVSSLTNKQLPKDIYDLFIKLINNFKNLFSSKKELDNQIIQFFLNYNIFIPIFDFKKFMQSYDAFHTMYPFMFTYDDATINGFNILSNDYRVVNEYLMIVVQIYAMIMMNDPTINLNLLLNHPNPGYANTTLIKGDKTHATLTIIRSLYDFLPYLNVQHVSVTQLQTYMLFLYYSLLTNNKEKSLVLSALVNAFIGILGINLNSKNLFFNDLSLNLDQKRDRVKVFWVFKVLLKCFNLKFGFKPSINTTVINPVTIDRYFELTPEKLSLLLDSSRGTDELFTTLLKPSVEFLNLVNIIIPSSFSPNYYQYLKLGSNNNLGHHHKKHPKLDWILNDDDGDGNDGNLNYNYNQFLTIDKNLSNWRYSLRDKQLNLIPLQLQMNLPILSSQTSNDLYHKITSNNAQSSSTISREGMVNYLLTGVPDIYSASQLIKIQLNFHCLLIRSMNYINFVIDKELTHPYYVKISNISREVLTYFLLIFEHVGAADEIDKIPASTGDTGSTMGSLGIDDDDDGFVINDFLFKRRKTNNPFNNQVKWKVRELPPSPFNSMLNGLSMTIINFKKSILLQMLFLLVSLSKFFKKEGLVADNVASTLNNSINLFIKIFINYQTNAATVFSSQLLKAKKYKEDTLFRKLMNDELRDQILREPRTNGDDSDDDELGSSRGINEIHETMDIDWDDEDMDEDLKYLKILKFVQYKINWLQEKSDYKLKRARALRQEGSRQPTPTVDSSDDKMQQVKQPNVVNMPLGLTGVSSSLHETDSLSSFYCSTSPPGPSQAAYSATSLLSKMQSEPRIDLADPKEEKNGNQADERLVANDLINLKRGYSKSGFSPESPVWNYTPNSTSPGGTTINPDTKTH